MYTCNCFIRKSTKELTEKVYRLGDRPGDWFWHSDIRTLLIVDNDKYYCKDDENDNDKNLIKQGYIDCKDNERMFLALAALRDDTDKNQWFINNQNGEFVFCKYDKFKYYILTDPTNLKSYVDISAEFHKATVSDIISHFSIIY